MNSNLAFPSAASENVRLKRRSASKKLGPCPMLRPAPAGRCELKSTPVTTLKGSPLDVSASQIRERVKAGRRIDHLTPRAVAEAIHNYHLYL